MILGSVGKQDDSDAVTALDGMDFPRCACEDPLGKMVKSSELAQLVTVCLVIVILIFARAKRAMLKQD